MNTLSCFKAYDIRGILGTEFHEDIAYRIGRAYSEQQKPKNVVVGNDVRLSSNSLKKALICGLNDSGVNVLDIGLSGTEEIYFATSYLKVDGGIEITASHNPKNYNGMKLVRNKSQPISNDSGLKEIQNLVENNLFKPPSSSRGTLRHVNILKKYVDYLLNFIDIKKFLHPIKLVINSGNGAAGHVIDEIENKFKLYNLPVSFIKINHDPDGNFPNGIPNPSLPSCRQDTINAVKSTGADIGIAFDGDFDRCFLFDERGVFIEGYYIVGLLAEFFLQKYPKSKIIHDSRLIWNTQNIITKAGGIPIMSKNGHSFIKERMRLENAIYGGEASSHHYFRDFFYCDSGMIPWLIISEIISISKKPLSELIGYNIQSYPTSGEINCTLNDFDATMARIKSRYIPMAIEIDMTDGLSLSFIDWRFNIRSSNTELLMRLNLESRGNVSLLKEKTEEILSLMDIIHVK